MNINIFISTSQLNIFLVRFFFIYFGLQYSMHAWVYEDLCMLWNNKSNIFIQASKNFWWKWYPKCLFLLQTRSLPVSPTIYIYIYRDRDLMSLGVVMFLVSLVAVSRLGTHEYWCQCSLSSTQLHSTDP